MIARARRKITNRLRVYGDILSRPLCLCLGQYGNRLAQGLRVVRRGPHLPAEEAGMAHWYPFKGIGPRIPWNRRLTNKEPRNSEGRRMDDRGTEEGRARNRRLTNKEPQNAQVQSVAAGSWNTQNRRHLKDGQASSKTPHFAVLRFLVRQSAVACSTFLGSSILGYSIDSEASARVSASMISSASYASSKVA